MLFKDSCSVITVVSVWGKGAQGTLSNAGDR